jgi:hypothetical protein
MWRQFVLATTRLAQGKIKKGERQQQEVAILMAAPPRAIAAWGTIDRPAPLVWGQRHLA